jgi:polysaccharide biosynthesis/export protein
LVRLSGLCLSTLTLASSEVARLSRGATDQGRALRWTRLGGTAALGAALLLGLAGCQTDPVPASGHLDSSGKFVESIPFARGTNQTAGPVAESVVLREGDAVRISFPGSPSLNTQQQIRRDGKLSLAMVGETQAAGLTPAQLEKELVKLYAPQLVNKEVNVSLESSAFQVFVTGAVARPGKLISDRPLTALEAVIDAGVDYQKANLKSVSIIRLENGHEKVQVLDLKKALQGTGGAPFYLKPSDIIFVRERFTWF